MLQDKNRVFVDITAHVLVVVHNPGTGACEQICGATAIDFAKNTVAYIDLKTYEKKTITGDIFLLIDKEELHSGSHS